MRENADQKKSEYGRFSRSVEKECNAKKNKNTKIIQIAVTDKEKLQYESRK